MKKLLIFVIFLVVLGYAWYAFSLRPVDPGSDVRRSVSIEKGMSVQSIAELLEAKDIIRSARAFTIYARLHGDQSLLQAGDFILRASMNVPEVIDTLKKGFSEEVTITIPEGFTVKDIDVLLTEKELIMAGEFTTCAQSCDLTGFGFLAQGADLAKRGGRVEGYLFPDTYFVIRDGFTAEKFMLRLLGTFRTRVIDGLAEDLKTSKRSLHEVITMASLVEEETRTDDERTMVSGILWKRFDAAQGLGVDATVRYILDKPTAAITVKDLDIDSPYNLRKYRGLPPGPIANAGIESIKASLHPEGSEYWYYLHDAKGVIHYAKTNDEHNQNKAVYLGR